MKIGFDISQTGAGKAGCGYLAYSLASELIGKRQSDQFVLLRTFGPTWWDQENRLITIPAGTASNVRYAGEFDTHAHAINFWRQNASSLEYQLDHLDIIHSNNFWSPPRMKHTRQVYTLHDMVVFECPEFSTDGNRDACTNGIASAACNSDFIIANSHFTLNNFLQYFDFDVERTAVIPLGNRLSADAGNDRRPARLAEIERFILCVGTIEPRKNYDSALEAFRIVAQRHDIYLVVAGKMGWGMEEFASLATFWGVGERVIWLSYVEDDELTWLYKNCALFLYPTWWEGFGLPVLEAMGLGCAVVTSGVTSLPEVCGDAARFIDPKNPLSIVEAVDDLLLNSQSRAALIEKAKLRADLFQWSKAASILGEVYDRIHLDIVQEHTTHVSLQGLAELAVTSAAPRNDAAANSDFEREHDHVRFWSAFAVEHGADWQKIQARKRLLFILTILDERAEQWADARILIINDGPVQTLGGVRSKMSVAVDTLTSVYVDAGLLQLNRPDDHTLYLSMSLEDPRIPPASFDLVIVNCAVAGADAAENLLALAIRAAAKDARIALNLGVKQVSAPLTSLTLEQSLRNRRHDSDVKILADSNTFRGRIRLFS